MSVGLYRGKVRLEAHQKEWETLAEETICTMRQILKEDVVDIQHVGSTSIRGILAKPIIDIAVGVTDFAKMRAHDAELAAQGILYRKEDRPGQILYIMGDPDSGFRTHFIHVVIWGSTAWNNYVNFRDHLNAHPDVAKRYSDLKEALAKPFAEDRESYTAAKAALISEILDEINKCSRKGREKIMDAHWFDKARYGMFIHWGLYALMGGVYEGQEVPYGAEWIMKNARIPFTEYQKLKDWFTAENFDADEIVRNAKRWGMEYLVFTAKHHDGFCMYHSKVSDYNIKNTPFGRDVVKELADACAKYGIVFCTYYSQMQDWADPNGWGNDWDFGPDREKDFEKYFRDKVKPQVKELLTGNGPISMMWFDTPYTMPKELCQELRDYVKELQPDCLVSGRVGYNLGDFREIPDNETPVLSFHKPWETPTTMNNTWGYSERDHEWKSAETIQHKLVTIVQKGGHLLLNIGPDGTGAVPEGSSKVLEEVGAWMEKNGESIYACEAVPDYSYQLRFGQITLRRQTLYLHVFNYPRFPHEIIVVDMPVQVKSVQLLTTGEPLKFIQSYEIARNEYRFRVLLPETCPDPIDTVVKVELEEPLRFQALQ